MSESERESKVLVVDDNASNVDLLQAYLADCGWEIDSANCGTTALEKTRTWRPDVILLDVMMPDMSGFDVCRTIKTDPVLRDIPVIMVTALTEVEDIEKGVDAGTDDFLSKPVNRLELVTRVKSLLRLRHLRNDLARTLAYLNTLEKSERK